MSISPRLAAALDAVGIAIFVIAGRQSHEIGGDVLWFLTVFWPLAAGWFAVALVTRLYTRPGWRRLAVTWLSGAGIGFLLRATVTERPTPIAFMLIALGFIAFINMGWRIVWMALRWQILRSRSN